MARKQKVTETLVCDTCEREVNIDDATGWKKVTFSFRDKNKVILECCGEDCVLDEISANINSTKMTVVIEDLDYSAKKL